MLDQVPLLGLLKGDVRDLVTGSFEAQTYPFGATLVRQGESADAFFVVIAGRARVLKTGDDGSEVALNMLGPGDSFGEAGLLVGGTRTATVRASSEVQALRLDGAVFRALMASNPAMRDAAELVIRRHAVSNLLRMYPAFGQLPADALAALLGDLEPVDVAAGEVVVREGEPAGPLYVVQEGRLRAYRQHGGPSGALSYYRRGALFGERSLFTGEPRSATVQAVSDARLLRLRPEPYGALLQRYGGFRDQITALVAQYEDRRSGAVPLDFAEELLPADADIVAVPPVGPDQVDRAPVEDAETTDERFRRRPRIRRFRLFRAVDEADCGAACLAMICRHFGRAVALSRVRRAVGTGLDGASLRGIAIGAKELGLASRALKVSRRNLDSLAMPAVLHWGGIHWVVAYDVTPTHVRVADPAVGLRRVRRADVDQKWSGYAVVFARTPALDQTPEGSVGASWLWPFFRPHLRTILSAALLALCVSGLQMSLPVFLQVIVDRVLPRRDVHLLRVLLLSLAGLLVVMAAGSVLQRLLLSRVAVRMDRETLDFLTGKLLALPMRYFYARRTGDIQRRLTGVRLVREFAVQSGVAALTAVAQLLAGLALMLYYSRLLTLVFFALAPAYAWLMWIASKRLRPIFESLEESFGQYFSRQIDAIKGIEAVKAMSAEDRLRRQLQGEFDALSRRLFHADFTAMTYDGAVQLLTFVSLASFLWAGSAQVLAGDLTIGALVSFNALVALASAPILVLLSLWDQVQLNVVLLNRLGDVFEEEPEQGADHSALQPVRSMQGWVRLEQVCVSYGGPTAPRILDKVNLDVAPGITVAIVGRSGSGKTTLAKCLAGLVEPTSGRILYDDVDMSTLDYRSLRRHIGFVLQDDFLFSDTIAANIAFGHEQPDHERIIWAAKVADAHDFVQRLPLGYETRVGETGLRLSGGQSQRIALARAVYSRPSVLILDEATSSLDTESETAVQENLQRVREGRTSFVIAHRLSTVRAADLIVVLDRGRLVEHGTHDELIARRGLYFYLSGQQLDV
jgi:ABC-type bacteriocin/lantibiotic exporter with double-glycine peptidase domain